MNPLEKLFPGLRNTDYNETSPIDVSYNCIAWAAGDLSRWWEPDATNQYYWPVEAGRSYALESFVAAYASIGYERTDSYQLESGVEKIAIFASPDGSASHAARQLPSGRWTSKLGRNVDIEHDLHALEGETYGRVSAFLKRARPSN